MLRSGRVAQFYRQGDEMDVHDTVIADDETVEESRQRIMGVFPFGDGQ
jgi:hypothetical protein